MAGRFGRSIAVLVFVGAAGVARPATFTVDDTADMVDQTPGDGICATAAATCTLRAAIQEANALPGADTIEIWQDLVGNPTLTIAGAGEDAAATGDLDITEDLVLDGSRALGAPGQIEALGVSGGDLDRVFHILPGVTAALKYVGVFDGATGPGENGGCILNEGTLTGLSLVQSCSAGGDGGGLYNSGNADVGARYILNTASGKGGAIANVGILKLEDDRYYASIGRNSAPSGGGIYNAGTLRTKAISIMENHATAGAGGGILNAFGGVANLADMTIGANTATSGGEAVDNAGTLDLRYVTVAAHATLGIRNDDGAGAITVTHAGILSDACEGSVSSLGYNFAVSCPLANAAATDHLGVDPEIESHADCAARYFGSICPNYHPHRNSPVIDAGDPADCKDQFGAPLVVDQNGVLKPTGATCDVGAIEATPVCEGGATTQTAKLIITGIGKGPGKQKIRYKGRIQDAGIPKLSFFGAQLAVEDLVADVALFDRSADNGGSLPAGGSIPFSCHMWKRSGTNYSYREIDHNCPNPPVGGVVKSLKVRDHTSGPEIGSLDLKFTITGISADVPAGAVRMSFVYGWFAFFSNGKCATTDFGPTACSVSGSGATVKCLLF
jgi:CSLREA domain-containing protein